MNDLPENLTRQARWRKQRPGKYRAHLAVQRALNAGRLEKLPCEICGNPKVDAHHPEYRSPLKVEWLCRRHHIQRHQQRRGRK